MAMGNRVGGTGLHAVAAKDAAVVVDVVDFGVALAATDAQSVGILRGFNIDAICRARRGAQKTSDALLQPILVALQHMGAAKTLLKDRGRVGVVVGDGRIEHFTKSDAHSFGYRGR